MIRCVKSLLQASAFGLFLSACQTAPEQLIIAPVEVSDPLTTKVAELKVQDQRPHSYLYRLKGSQEQVEFAPPQRPLSETIEASLRPLVSTEQVNSPLRWLVSIEQALVEATSSNFKYQLTHRLVLRVEAENANRRYSNSYSGQSQSTGIGRPDEAQLEREFSRLLQSLLSDISRDPKLRITSQENK